MADMTESKAARLQLVGGALSLDFTNTAGNHESPLPSEHLLNYADLVEWSRHAGIIDNQVARRLLDNAARRPDKASQVLERAIALREAMYRIFLAASTGAAPRATDMELLNRSLADAMAHARLIEMDGGFGWDWTHQEDALDSMLAPITRSAGDLLTSDDLSRVRECDGDTCGWLFIDKSKNHSRRWCAMNDCGNRAKARRHYKRVRGMR